MSDQMPPVGISAEEWAATPLAVRALVMELLRRLAQVEARLNQTSRNSSKPPSSDPPQTKPRATKAPPAARRAGSPDMKGTDVN
jgi:transposase